MNRTDAAQPEPPAAAASLRDRQRDALAELRALAARFDEMDRVHHTGREARSAWIAWRYQHAQERLEARQAKHDRATAEYEAARQAFAAAQAEQRQSQQREDEEMIEQVAEQNEAERARVMEAEELDRSSAANRRSRKLLQLEEWHTHRTRQHQLWVAQLARFREQRDERLATFPPVMRRDVGQTPPPKLDLSPDPDQATRLIEQFNDRSLRALHRLHSLTLPHMLFGVEPYLFAVIGIVVGAALGPLATIIWPQLGLSTLVAMVLGVGAAIVIAALSVVAVFFVARHQVAAAHREADAAFAAMDLAIQHGAKITQVIHDQRADDAQIEFDQRQRQFDEKYGHLHKSTADKCDTAMRHVRDVVAGRRRNFDAAQRQALEDFESGYKAKLDRMAGRIALRRRVADQRRRRDLERLDEVFGRAQDAMLQQWAEGCDEALATLEETRQLDAATNPPWPDPSWSGWKPDQTRSPLARFGQFDVGPDQLIDPQARGGRFDLNLPEGLTAPAILAAPNRRSLLIQTGPEGRDAALGAMRSVMLRLLTTLPPGHAKFTMLDPVGLGQTFAGFMHLADYDESVVDTRIWSEPEQMHRRLVDLTDHLSYVIQKHLRNQYDSIDAYNRQAGDLAEPLRFLVVADYPHRLSPESVERIASIAASGPRCGVFVLAVQDVRQPLATETGNDLAASCFTVRQVTDDQGRSTFQCADEVYSHFPLTLDPAPDEATLNRLVNRVGQASVEAKRVELPFETIVPGDEGLWSKSSAADLVAPIGKAGATKRQAITFGHGVAQHALLAGKTGSGKSSLLHAMITNFALWYSPDELELYLIDFKKGVEFKPYVTYGLPHARAIAIESDRAFGYSILKRLDEQMNERGEKFRRAGVQDVAGYRKAKPDELMPRVLLIVDEFQELFSQDDEIALNSATLLDRLVRQGRAFGMHALLGSQSLTGAAGLAMGTMSQMAIRIALMCGEADSQLILSDDNTAARLLRRPGEAIYNDQGGLPTANVFFQVAWLPDEQNRHQLGRIRDLAKQTETRRRPCVVFEGSAPADLADNAHLTEWAQSAPPRDAHRVDRAYLGEPVAIDEPAALELLRQAGSNGLIVGQQGDAAQGMFAAAMLSLAAQHAPATARFVVFNGSPEPDHARRFDQLAKALPHKVELIPWRRTPDAVGALHAQLQERLAAESDAAESVYVMIFALQRLRDLRRSEDDFGSFSLDSDKPAPPKPDRQFVELLHEGPAVGVHTLVWCDRVTALDQALERRDLRAFDQRVLFQMSANDSAHLVDSPAASRLGPFRVLLSREDRGTFQTLRPYGWPDHGWLKSFADRLAHRAAAPPPHADTARK